MRPLPFATRSLSLPLALPLLLAACDSGTGPETGPSTPTLSIAPFACSVDEGCADMGVGVSTDAGVFTPIGFLSAPMDTVRRGFGGTCLSFPAEARTRVDRDSAGVTVDSVVTTWTPADPQRVVVYLGSVFRAAETELFVPASREGWSLRVVQTTGGPEVTVEPAPRCD